MTSTWPQHRRIAVPTVMPQSRLVGPFASPSGYLTNVDGRNRSTLYRVDLARGQTHGVGQVVTVSKRGKARRTVLTGLAAVQD
jgi:hypothetical protein